MMNGYDGRRKARRMFYRGEFDVESKLSDRSVDLELASISSSNVLHILWTTCKLIGGNKQTQSKMFYEEKKSGIKGSIFAKFDTGTQWKYPLPWTKSSYIALSIRLCSSSN